MIHVNVHLPSDMSAVPEAMEGSGGKFMSGGQCNTNMHQNIDKSNMSDRRIPAIKHIFISQTLEAVYGPWQRP